MAFFASMPLPVQFFLAFVIVFGLIGVTAWAARHLGSGRLGGRRFIVVRRDNVEHLLMIGGPTDIVVASYIANRAPAAPRPLLAPREDTITANRLASTRPSTTALRNKPVAAASSSEGTARTPRGTLAALADLLSTPSGTSPRGRIPANTRAAAPGAAPDEPPLSPQSAEPLMLASPEVLVSTAHAPC